MELLIATSQGRPDKNDVLLQDLVKQGNLKQALANVDKRLKRTKTDRALINRALILLSFFSPEKNFKGLRLIEELSKKESVVTDPDFLRVIDKANVIRGGGLESLMDDMWERAAKAAPGNEAVLAEWLSRSLAELNYKAAVRAAMLAMNRIKTHDTLFQFVACCHIAATTSGSDRSAKDRELWATMAYRTLAKAAADTIKLLKDGDQSGTPAAETRADSSDDRRRPTLSRDPASRTFQDSDDVELYVKVLSHQGRSQEAIDVLYPENEAPTLLLATNDTPAVVFLLRLLRDAKQWHRLYELSRDLLIGACLSEGIIQGRGSPLQTFFGARGRDLRVWESFGDAVRELGFTSERIVGFLTLLPRLRELDARSSTLISVQCSLDAHHQGVLTLDADAFQAAVIKPLLFFVTHVPSDAALRDIERIWSRFSRSEQLEFIVQLRETLGGPESGSAGTPSIATRRQWVQRCLSISNIEYRLLGCGAENQADLELQDEFITFSLRVYRDARALHDQSRVERGFGDAAAVVAASACVRTYRQRRDCSLLRAIIILEELLVHSPHNYDALILLIRLYCYNGAVTKAAALYKRLEVKNSQVIPMAWILHQRLSSIYPTETKGSSWAPMAELMHEADVADRYEHSSKSVTLDLVKQQRHSHLLDMVGSRRNWSTSVSRFVLFAELRGMDPLDGPNDVIGERLINILDDDMCDGRDLSAINSYELEGEQTLEEFLQSGPWPTRTWCVFRARLLFLQRRLVNPPYFRKVEAFLEDWLHELDDDHPIITLGDSDKCREKWPDLTPPERTLYKLMQVAQYTYHRVWSDKARGPKRPDRWGDLIAFCAAGSWLALDAADVKKFAADPMGNLRYHKGALFHALHTRLDAVELHLNMMVTVGWSANEQGLNVGPVDWLARKYQEAVDRAIYICERVRTGGQKLRAELQGPDAVESMLGDATGGDSRAGKALRAFDEERVQGYCGGFRNSLICTVDALIQKADKVDPLSPAFVRPVFR